MKMKTNKIQRTERVNNTKKENMWERNRATRTRSYRKYTLLMLLKMSSSTEHWKRFQHVFRTIFILLLLLPFLLLLLLLSIFASIFIPFIACLVLLFLVSISRFLSPLLSLSIYLSRFCSRSRYLSLPLSGSLGLSVSLPVALPGLHLSLAPSLYPVSSRFLLFHSFSPRTSRPAVLFVFNTHIYVLFRICYSFGWIFRANSRKRAACLDIWFTCINFIHFQTHWHTFLC